MLATILLGAIGAALMALILERRIGAINDSIAGILSGDLSQRIPVARGGDDDDFGRLIVNFNHMLDRIAQLMEDLKQLSDNIAHDLRTPLTRLRNRLAGIEFDAQGGRSEAVAELLAESDELLATFNALLRIAQIESGNRRSGFAATDLVTIMRDVCEFYEPLAADKEQKVSVALPPSCPGVFDRDLLFQAFANLLDNAIKYAPRGRAHRGAARRGHGRRDSQHRRRRPRHSGRGARPGVPAFLPRRGKPQRSSRQRARTEPGAGCHQPARRWRATRRQRPGAARHRVAAARRRARLRLSPVAPVPARWCRA